MIFLKKFTINSLLKKIKPLQHNRLFNQVNEVMIAKEINYYLALAAIYKSLKGKKKYPFAHISEQECIRAAAALDHVPSKVNLGTHLLEDAKYRESVQQSEIFANAQNERLMQQFYEEAHAHLLSAENLGSIAAKRTRGLCFINGWGVESDKKKGFDLVVASIDQENSWDRLPEIFSKIGLNKPEFFSELGKHKSQF